jgi:hypothetical protein
MDTLVAVFAAIVVILVGAKLLVRHDRGGSVRVVDEPPPASELTAPDRPRLDPSSAHLDTSLRALPAEPRMRHDRDWALERMQPRARVDTATILIVATVIVVLIAIALAGYAIEHRRGTTPSTSTTTTRPVTTSTQPTAYVPRSTSGGTAIYVAPTGHYSVTITGTGGPIWVSAATPPSSTHTVSRLVAAGGSTTFPFDAAGIIELGAPGDATVTLDGVAVTFPPGYSAPLNLEFRPPT